jgi:putative redox protein
MSYELKADRADAIPAVFTDIHLHFVVTGKAVKEKQVAKAVELSAEKYCSASKMLSDGGVKLRMILKLLKLNKFSLKII